MSIKSHFLNSDEADSEYFCSWYLNIEEEGLTAIEHNLCISDLRQLQIYSSSGSKIVMSVRTSSDINMLPPFLIQFKGKSKLHVSCIKGMRDIDPLNSAFMLFLQLDLSLLFLSFDVHINDKILYRLSRSEQCIRP